MNPGFETWVDVGRMGSNPTVTAILGQIDVLLGRSRSGPFRLVPSRSVSDVGTAVVRGFLEQVRPLRVIVSSRNETDSDSLRRIGRDVGLSSRWAVPTLCPRDFTWACCPPETEVQSPPSPLSSAFHRRSLGLGYSEGGILERSSPRRPMGVRAARLTRFADSSPRRCRSRRECGSAERRPRE